MSVQEMSPFMDCVEFCELQRMKWVGDQYTWCNRQGQDTRIWSRIVWALVNQNWMIKYPNLYVQTLPELISDHRPLLIQLNCEERKIKGGFKFCNMWILSQDFRATVAIYWKVQQWGSRLVGIQKNLKLLKQPLLNLHKKQFSNIRQQADAARDTLIQIQNALHRDPQNRQLQTQEMQLGRRC